MYFIHRKTSLCKYIYTKIHAVSTSVDIAINVSTSLNASRVQSVHIIAFRLSLNVSRVFISFIQGGSLSQMLYPLCLKLFSVRRKFAFGGIQVLFNISSSPILVNSRCMIIHITQGCQCQTMYNFKHFYCSMEISSILQLEYLGLLMDIYCRRQSWHFQDILQTSVLNTLEYLTICLSQTVENHVTIFKMWFHQ